MPDFMFIYHGGATPTTEAAQKAAMAAWGDWMERYHDALVDPGNPVGKSRTVSSGGIVHNGGANPTSGYTIVSAPDMDAACTMASTNPILMDGGTIEIAEIHKMEM